MCDKKCFLFLEVQRRNYTPLLLFVESVLSRPMRTTSNLESVSWFIRGCGQKLIQDLNYCSSLYNTQLHADIFSFKSHPCFEFMLHLGYLTLRTEVSKENIWISHFKWWQEKGGKPALRACTVSVVLMPVWHTHWNIWCVKNDPDSSSAELQYLSTQGLLGVMSKLALITPSANHSRSASATWISMPDFQLYLH